MKIGLLHYTKSPVVGGVERVMAEQAEVLAAAGHEVETFAADDAPRLAQAGCKVILLHNVCTMPFQPALTQFLRDWAARDYATRFICWTHDVAEGWGGAFPHFEYVAVSEVVRQRLEARDRCRVIPNGFWPLRRLSLSPSVAALAKEHRLLERGPVLFQPARWVRRKRVEFALEVTAALRASGEDAVLMVTAASDPHQADGFAYAAEMRFLRQKLGLEKDALFLGDSRDSPDEDVDSLYRIADAVVIPSRLEGFGLPILEAAVHRVPVFAPAIPPMHELLPGPGERFPANETAPEVAARIVRALAFSGRGTRKAAWQPYAWPVIHRKYLAPLLEEPPTSRRP